MNIETDVSKKYRSCLICFSSYSAAKKTMETIFETEMYKFFWMNVFGEIVSPFLMDAQSTSISSGAEKDCLSSAENTQISDSLSKTSSQAQLEIEDTKKETQIDKKNLMQKILFDEDDNSIPGGHKVISSNDGLYHYLNSETHRLSKERESIWPLPDSKIHLKPAQTGISAKFILSENQSKKSHLGNNKTMDNFLKISDSISDSIIDSGNKQNSSLTSTNAGTQTSPEIKGNLMGFENKVTKKCFEEKKLSPLQSKSTQDAFNYFFPNSHLFVNDLTPTNFRNQENQNITHLSASFNTNNSDDKPTKFMMAKNSTSNKNYNMISQEPRNFMPFVEGIGYQNQYSYELAQSQSNFSPFKMNSGCHLFQQSQGNYIGLRSQIHNMSNKIIVDMGNYNRRINNF